MLLKNKFWRSSTETFVLVRLDAHIFCLITGITEGLHKPHYDSKRLIQLLFKSPSHN